MKTIKHLAIGMLILCLGFTPKQSFAIGIGGTEIPYLMELIAQSSAISSTATQVFTVVKDMKDEVVRVIEVAQEITMMYESSQELISATDKTLEIYTVYLETLSYISKNQIYLTDAQIDVLIKTMDAAAFGLHATDNPRPKGLKRVANGALENLPQVMKMLTTSQNTNVADVVTLMDNTTRKINTCLRKTDSASRYCRSVIRQAKIAAGVYDIEEAIERFRNM